MTTILVIEDDEIIRSNVLDLLTAEGFSAIGAENGLVGVRAAREHLPGLIICDIMMPELDGYGVLAALRQDPVTSTIPFIFLTAKAGWADLRHGMALGADDYLTKPFTRKELLQAIDTRLARQATLIRQFQKQLEDLRGSITLSLPHELRTPLVGILGFSAALVDSYDSVDSREILATAKIIHASAQRLHRLIDNYLLYAELEIIGVDPEHVKTLRAIDQASSLRTAVTAAAVQAAKKAGREADLNLDLQDAAVPLADMHLKKIVEELVNNAFKYSTAGTPVRVTSRPGSHTIDLFVVDHGRGMTAEQIASVGAYVQFDRKLHEQQGLGLGLTIAKRLAELYGGAVAIESIPGAQTTAHVTFPA